MAPVYFISRHQMTESQRKIVSRYWGEVIHVGDADGFTEDFSKYVDGLIVVVHPAAAIRAVAMGCTVGIFNNVNRAPEGERPSFETTEMHVFTSVPKTSDTFTFVVKDDGYTDLETMKKIRG